MECRPVANPRCLKRPCLACGTRTNSKYQLCPDHYALYYPLQPLCRECGPADTKLQREALVEQGVEDIMRDARAKALAGGY